MVGRLRIQRLATAAVAAWLGLSLALAGCGSARNQHQAKLAAPATTAATAPGAGAGTGTGAPAAVAPPTMLVWVSRGLPARFAARVGALPGVRRVVAVVSGTVWMTRSASASGRTVDRPPAGMAIPLELAGADPAALAPFVPAVSGNLRASLEGGRAVLGATSARLRRLGAGGTLELTPAPGTGGAERRVSVAGMVPDAATGAHELLVSRTTAAALGQTTERYLLVAPAAGTAWQTVAARIRALLPASALPLLRIRGPGQARYLRQADAVLAPVEEKALFGEFAANPQPRAGGRLTIDPRWVAAHITTASVPLLGPVTCNRAILPQLRGALAEVQRRGLGSLVHVNDFAGCYAARLIPGDPGPSIAHHAWGSAIDINARANPLGQHPTQDRRLVAIFERWGFAWGGDFLVPDGMHFELLHQTPQAPAG